MKNLILITFLCTVNSQLLVAQQVVDSLTASQKIEYMTVVTEILPSKTYIFISKDSLVYEKKELSYGSFNLTEALKTISTLEKDGWCVKNSNMVLAGPGQPPYITYVYYLLCRRKEE
ncbi:MAG TPA: hypothetical protein VMV56_02570 [Williamwhitmania sp.]|nr:hypothetical protein [Williamwhitmania sp.]